MIGWTGFLGKWLDFAITKLANKKFDVVLDGKIRACKAFIKFFDSILQLEAVTTELLRKFDPIIEGKKSRLYGVWLKEMPPKIETASKEFLSSLEELALAIYLYDPILSHMITRIMDDKFTLMEIGLSSKVLSNMKFEIDWKNEKSINSLNYTIPADELMKLDFEGNYDTLLKKYKEGAWPENFLLKVIDGKVINDEVEPNDIDKIKYLYGKLESHLLILSKARENLREFIKNRFSIEDLLYTHARPFSKNTKSVFSLYHLPLADDKPQKEDVSIKKQN